MCAENQTKENITLGELLRQARESMGLSVQQVSDYLFISTSVIKDIEADARQDGVSDVFWRGYIRAYAKYIQVEQQTLQAYLPEVLPFNIETVKKSRDYTQREERKKQIKWLVLFSSAIAIFLFVMLVWWWHEHNLSTQQPNSIISTASINSPNNTDATSISAANKGSVATTVSKTEPSIVSDESDTPTVASNHQHTTDTALHQITNEDVENRVPLSSDEVQSSTTPLTNHNEIKASSVTNQSEQSSTQLAMSFSGACWVKITDGDTQKVLYVGEESADGTLKFDNASKYELVIGAPHNTTVVYNGKTINLAPYTGSNKVARLTLSSSDE